MKNLPQAIQSALIFALCAFPGRVSAIHAIEVQIASATTSNGIALQNTHAHLILFDEHRAALELHSQTLQAPFLAHPLKELSLRCANPLLHEPSFECPVLRIAVQESPLGPQALQGAVSYHTGSGTVRGALRGARVAGGSLDASGALTATSWQFSANARALSLPELAMLVRPWAALPDGFTLAGRMDAKLASRGDGNGPRHSELVAQLRGVTASNQDGTIASDALNMDVRALLEDKNPMQYTLQLDSSGGQLLISSVLADFGMHPLHVQAAGAWQPEALIVRSLSVRQPDVVELKGSVALALTPAFSIRNADIDVERASFPATYASFLQTALGGTDFANLESSGNANARFVVANDALVSADAELHSLVFNDAKKGLGVNGLDGTLHWRAEGPAPASRIAWHDMALYGLQAGTASVSFTTSARSFALDRPVRIPVFDGALAVQNFSATLADSAASASVALQFDATLEPISMAKLSTAFGWPEMSGSLAGRIPGVQYRDNILSIAGDLTAQVFDGRVTVSKLMLQDPLGAWPRFNASITARNLDLDRITHTFPIGSITGRLDADIGGLELFDWQPVAFDARLYTTPGDRSRHRISQRAITSISDIGGGGGVAAALQNGLLKFFDDFGYDRIGLSCQLRDDVCIMGGIPRKEGGFYIVKGGGLPRIDITGNSGRVSWSTLLSQITAAINNSGEVQVR